MLIDERHNKGLDEYVIKEEVYEAQGDYSDAKDDLRALGTHLHVVRCFACI